MFFFPTNKQINKYKKTQSNTKELRQLLYLTVFSYKIIFSKNVEPIH